MSLIRETILEHLPYRRRQTPSGWISFNAVCCDDKRNRGGLIFDGETVSYHCFNCGFKASWQPGRTVSVKLKKLFNYLNVSDDLIAKLCIEALKHKDIEVNRIEVTVPKFTTKTLPRGSRLIYNLLDNIPEKLYPVIEYIYSRGLSLDDYDFYWSDEEGFDNRLIIPYYYRGSIVGYTCRRIDNGKPKYLADQQPGYVFNLDNQLIDRQFVIVCEGQLDAISIDCVSVMSNEINDAQSLLIKQLGKEVIVVPDRDQAGLNLINSAIKHNFTVSLPDWKVGVKDINDAIQQYGKINTLKIILDSKLDSELKIKLKMKDWIKKDYD